MKSSNLDVELKTNRWVKTREQLKIKKKLLHHTGNADMEINSSHVDSLRRTNSNAEEPGDDLSGVRETSAVNSRTTTGNNSIKSKNEPSKNETGGNFGSHRTTRANEAKLTR